jgi:hypothetical protein
LFAGAEYAWLRPGNCLRLARENQPTRGFIP